MKKYIPLFAIITVSFIICFISINTRYNEFYRVPGASDERVKMFKEYLTAEEQKYLVENVINSSLFIDYIEDDNFKLINYENYNSVRIVYSDMPLNELIIKTNNVIEKLSLVAPLDIEVKLAQLLQAGLFEDAARSSDFDYDSIAYYGAIAPAYEGNTLYIKDTILLKEALVKQGVSENNLLSAFQSIGKNYNSQGIRKLLNNSKTNENSKIVIDPSQLLTIVNNGNYIGSYEIPDDQLSIALDIPRVIYSIYLRQNAYDNLKNMCAAIESELEGNCGGMLLYLGYQTEGELSYLASGIAGTFAAGYNEFQLGNTIMITLRDIGKRDFADTKLYQWLVDHGHEYGYIVRYPQGKEQITGHAYSNNIFRYIGVDNATLVHENNIALEEVATWVKE